MVCEVTKDNAFAVLGQAVSSLEADKTYTVEIKEKKKSEAENQMRTLGRCLISSPKSYTYQKKTYTEI